MGLDEAEKVGVSGRDHLKQPKVLSTHRPEVSAHVQFSGYTVTHLPVNRQNPDPYHHQKSPSPHVFSW